MFDIHWRAKHVAKWLTFCRLHNSNSNSNRRQQQQSQQPTVTVPVPPTTSTSSAAKSNRQQAGKSNSVHQLIALVANRLADANIVGNMMPCNKCNMCGNLATCTYGLTIMVCSISNIFDIFHIYVYGQQQQLLIDCRQLTSVVAVVVVAVVGPCLPLI